jgi:hypothetical protein
LPSKPTLASRQRQLLVLGDHQRVDLEQAHVGLDEGLVELDRHRDHLLGEIAVEAERLGEAAHVMRTGCPVTGSTVMVTIFSGVSCATFSMSMPPSVEATIATREDSRSTSIER